MDKKNTAESQAGKKFGLIGRRLGHSLSPEIHSILGAYEYKLYEVEAEDLKSFIETTDLDGFNITIPYKEAVLPFCTDLTSRAKETGSVNTMKRLPGGGFIGDNTDYVGFSRLLENVWGKVTVNQDSPSSDGLEFRGVRVLVLGSGGASKAVCAVLKEKGANFTIVSRTGDVNYDNVILKVPDAELVVNTTPVGMFPNTDASPLDLSHFEHLKAVIDIIYNPPKTRLIRQAENLGLTVANGMTMLLAQAEAANFGDSTPNIVLIGMPGVGKTSFGKKLAQDLGRSFFDTDEEIEKRSGMTIPEIFSAWGEEEFRRIESEILKELSKKDGLVIATGGGVVTRPENKNFLSKARVVHLKRPLEKLPTKGRPLSQTQGIEKLWNERKDLYKEWADLEIEL